MLSRVLLAVAIKSRVSDCSLRRLRVGAERDTMARSGAAGGKSQYGYALLLLYKVSPAVQNCPN